jgi:hypothetical protein
MRRPAHDAIREALHWVYAPTSAATRGRRIIAWGIAIEGPKIVNGCASLKAAAKAKKIPEATLHRMLTQLRARYGLAPPCDELSKQTCAAKYQPDMDDCAPRTRGEY